MGVAIYLFILLLKIIFHYFFFLSLLPLSPSLSVCLSLPPSLPPSLSLSHRFILILSPSLLMGVLRSKFGVSLLINYGNTPMSTDTLYKLFIIKDLMQYLIVPHPLLPEASHHLLPLLK